MNDPKMDAITIDDVAALLGMPPTDPPAKTAGRSVLYIQHERWTDDRWRVILRVNGDAFAIGADCPTLIEAQELRAAFKLALTHLLCTERGHEIESEG